MFGIDDIANMIAAQQASKVQQDNAQKAMGVQQGIYDQSRADQQPYMDAGQQFLGGLVQSLGSGAFNTQYQGVNLNPSDVANDPGYQFRMAQGQKALERSAAARGGLNSGGFMKGLADYSQGLASTEYGNAWNRNFQSSQAQNHFNQNENQSRFGRLYQMAGMGQNSAQNLAHTGTQYADAMSNLYGVIGNARAAGITATAKWAGKAGNDAANSILSFGGGGGGGGDMPGMDGMEGGPGGGGYIPSQYGQAPSNFNAGSQYPYYEGY